MHGVGISFSTSIIGLIKYLNLEFSPLNSPKQNASKKDTSKARNVLAKDWRNAVHTCASITNCPKVANKWGTSGNKELLLTKIAINSHNKKMNKTPSDS